MTKTKPTPEEAKAREVREAAKLIRRFKARKFLQLPDAVRAAFVKAAHALSDFYYEIQPADDGELLTAAWLEPQGKSVLGCRAKEGGPPADDSHKNERVVLFEFGGPMLRLCCWQDLSLWWVAGIDTHNEHLTETEIEPLKTRGEFRQVLATLSLLKLKPTPCPEWWARYLKRKGVTDDGNT